MYIGTSGMSAKGLIKNKIWVLVITITIYSVIAAFLIRFEIVRPFKI